MKLSLVKEGGRREGDLFRFLKNSTQKLRRYHKCKKRVIEGREWDECREGGGEVRE